MAHEISLRQVTKVYNPGRPDQVTALGGVTLRVAAGETVALVGPSGSGKTTLLSLLGCMSRPTSGSVVVDGRNVSKLPERFLTEVRRSSFGFIFQQFHLVRGLTVLENVLLPLYPLTMGAAEMHRRAEAALERLRLGHKARARAGNLSGGEQQRVAIARALVNEPRVLVADEPTAHLDSELSDELLALLADLRGEGRTLVLATHDPRVYDHPLVDRRVRLRDGKMVEGEGG